MKELVRGSSEQYLKHFPYILHRWRLQQSILYAFLWINGSTLFYQKSIRTLIITPLVFAPQFWNIFPEVCYACPHTDSLDSNHYSLLDLVLMKKIHARMNCLVKYFIGLKKSFLSLHLFVLLSSSYSTTLKRGSLIIFNVLALLLLQFRVYLKGGISQL